MERLPAPGLRPPITRPAAVWIAWGLWGLVCLVIVGMIVAGNRRTVTPSYEVGARFWLTGQPLYVTAGAGFIYLPQSAIVFIPFAQLPHVPREIAWRVLTIGTFLMGLWRFARLSRREHGVELFGFMTLLCLPMSFSSMRNGQATLPLAGLMMLAVADQCDRRWWRAALWLSLGLIVKPLMVVPILLSAALYPALRWRLAVGLAAVFGFPFLCQRPDYVLRSYVDCVNMLRDADHLGHVHDWAQLFGMLRVFGWDVPHGAQSLVRGVAAVATLGLCWRSLKAQSAVQAHLQQFALAAVYLMLMNPRTENNTYSLLSPALAVCCGQAWLVCQQWARGGLLLAAAVTIVSSYEVGKLFVPPSQAVFLAPLGCLLFAALLVRDVLAAPSAELSAWRRQQTPRNHPTGISRAA